MGKLDEWSAACYLIRDGSSVLGISTGMKPDVLKVAITVLCLTAQIPFADAATYYVSTSTGNDANAGTNSSAPWKSPSKIYYKCISAQKFAPGDSILLKAGDSFEQTINHYNAGTKDAPITIGRYGTGANPIIYGNSPGVTWSAVNGYTGLYSATPALPSTINFVGDTNGVIYSKLSQGTNSLSVWLGKFTNATWGFSFDAPTNIYIRTTDDNPPTQMHLLQFAGVLFDKDYVTVENLDIRNCVHGIVGNTSKGFIVRNNSVQDTKGSGMFFGNSSSYGEVATNTITRTGWTMLYFQTGGNHWAHHNTLSVSTKTILGFFINGNELAGIGLERGTNNLVEHNAISYVHGSFHDYWLEVNSEVRYNYGFHSSGAAYPEGTGLKLHNNIFNVDGGRGIGGQHDYTEGLSPLPDTGPNLIYNNVVYNPTAYGFYGGANVSAGVKFRNNIIVVTTTTNALLSLYDGGDSDFNVFYCTAGAPRGWFWKNTRYATLAAFQAASGQDAHSIYADPQFVSAGPVKAADFRLRSTSPCINVGLDLKAAGLLVSSQEYKDYLGTLIPRGFRPEIGPYEIPAPDTPSNLQIHQ